MKSARGRRAVGTTLVGLGLLSARGATELPPLVVVAPPDPGETVERSGGQPVARPGLDWVRQGGAGGQSDLRLFGSAYNAGGYSLGGLALENPQTEHFHAWVPLPAHWFSAPRLLSATEQSGLTQGHLAGTLALELAPLQAAGSATAAGGTRGYQRQALALAPRPADGAAGPFALAFERERRPNADRLDNDQETVLGALRWGHTSPEGQLDVLAGSSWRQFGAQGYYGVSPALPAEETVRDRLVLAQARFTGGPAHPLRASLLWRETTDAYRLTLPNAPLFANDHRTRQAAALLAGQTPLPGLPPTAPLRPSLDWRLTADQQTLDSNALGDHHRGRLTALALPRFAAARWALSAGFETQGLSRERPVVLPQAALEWHLPARQLLRLAYAETVRRPSYTELNYESPASLGQAGLANERAETWEATLRGQTADRRVSWSVGAFRRASRQAVDWILAGPESARWTAVNLERLRVHGALAEIRYAPWDWLRVTAGGQWLSKRAAVTPYASRYQLDYPEWRGDLTVIVSPAPRWQCALRQTWSAQTENPARAGRNSASQGLLEWAWQPGLTDRWTIEAGVENLWNDTFEPAPGVPAARRLVTAGIRATW
ncbi:MAG: TonB-dependent receptor [Candidatus Marinimicrobia bacterium]|nr:TonB-dependent receptor [Candidatus Neomarinimicrobiota bacterium]